MNRRRVSTILWGKGGKLAAFTAAALAATVAAGGLLHARGAARTAAAARAAGAGRQLTWKVALDVRMQQPSGQSAGHDTAMKLTGELVATVSGAAKEGTALAYELRHPQLEGTGFGQVSPADVKAVEEKLARRFWVTEQADGAARLVHFPRDLAPDARNLLTLLVTETQLVRPANPAPQWTTTERDAAGVYLAAYRQTSAREIVKRKLRYLAVDGTGRPATMPVDVRIEDTDGRYTLDDGGRVAAVAIHDRARIAVGIGGTSLVTEMRLTLTDLRVGEAPELIGSLDRARGDVETGPVIAQAASPEAQQARQDAELIKGVSLSHVLSTLGTDDANAKARPQLEALFRQRPGDTRDALAFVRQAPAPAAKQVLQALGAAGSPAAQEALGRLAVDEHAPTSQRVTAIGALVQTKHPTSATLDWLVRLLDAPEAKVRKQATFLIGAVGSACIETDPAVGARVEAELIRRYRACRGEDCTGPLVGLGNLNTPGIVPIVAEALRDPSPRVRAVATGALAAVQHPDADRLIATAMTDDRDPTVRAAAVRAASNRPIGPLADAFAHVVRSDPAEYVRTDAIQAITQHVDESTQIQEALVAAATSDASPGVKRMARQALGPRLTKKL
jgi:HEAT repeat protein